MLRLAASSTPELACYTAVRCSDLHLPDAPEPASEMGFGKPVAIVVSDGL